MNVSELTSGEKLLIDRRRRQLTAAQAAKRRKVTLYRYNRFERDQERGPKVSLGALRPHEVAVLRRRRAGLSVGQLAKRLGVSAWWLSQMEAGKAPAGRLLAHWKGAPSPSRAKRRSGRLLRAPGRKRRRAS